MFLYVLSQFNFPDPDMFHEMALARQAVQLRHVPTRDLFAYTPTVYPVVHHEWGTGLILLLITGQWGSPGLVATRLVLAFGTVLIAVRLARRRYATWPAIALTALFVALPLAKGFGTIRAQEFTLLLTAILLNLLECHREGSRRWVFIWLPLYVIWLNLHGGFVAGVGLFVAYTLESLLRDTRKRILSLLVALAAMPLLVLVNPYGTAYLRYILHATIMPRPQIAEWAPIWDAGAPAIAAFAAAGLLFLYCLLKNGWRNTPGFLVLLAAMAVATLHLRHASLAALVTLCYVPAWLKPTPLGMALDGLFARQHCAVTFAGLLFSALCLAPTLRQPPWRLPVPANAEDWAKQPVVYPAGAADYLRGCKIPANVMTPFTVGGFVSWKCYPLIKVGIDGRYEVAYDPSLLTEINDCYAGKPGWLDTLRRYPTDLVLVPHPAQLRSLLSDQTAWSCVYRDDAYELWARPGLTLPAADRRGRNIVASIP